MALTAGDPSPPSGVHEMPRSETTIDVSYNPANQYQMKDESLNIPRHMRVSEIKIRRAGTCALHCDRKDLIGPTGLIQLHILAGTSYEHPILLNA